MKASELIRAIRQITIDQRLHDPELQVKIGKWGLKILRVVPNKHSTKLNIVAEE